MFNPFLHKAVLNSFVLIASAFLVISCKSSDDKQPSIVSAKKTENPTTPTTPQTEPDGSKIEFPNTPKVNTNTEHVLPVRPKAAEEGMPREAGQASDEFGPMTTKRASSLMTRNSKNFDVILIGDPDHSDPRVFSSFADQIRSFKEGMPELDCVLLELDQQFQPGLDAFRKSGDFVKFLEKNKFDFSKGMKDSVETFLLAAKKSQLKIIATDINSSTPTGKDVLNKTRQWIKNPASNSDMDAAWDAMNNIRNGVIAENIVKLKQNGICKKPLQIIGRSHIDHQAMAQELLDKYRGPRLTLLQEKLKEKNLTSISGFLFVNNCATAKAPFTCADVSKLLVESKGPITYLGSLRDSDDFSKMSFLMLAPY